jgi:hypothetical protein
MPGGVALLELQAQDLGVGGRPVSWPLDHYPLFEQVELPTRSGGGLTANKRGFIEPTTVFFNFFYVRTF